MQTDDTQLSCNPIILFLDWSVMSHSLTVLSQLPDTKTNYYWKYILKIQNHRTNLLFCFRMDYLSLKA